MGVGDCRGSPRARRALALGLLLGLLALAGPADAAQFPDADMEAAGCEAWHPYATPVTVEKTTEAHSGRIDLVEAE